MNGASQTILKMIVTIIGVIIAASLAYPLGFIIAQSILGRGNIILSDINDLTKYGISLENYIRVISNQLFQTCLLNTLLVAVITTIIAIFIIIPAGYAFSRFEFLGKNTLLYYYLIVSQVGGGLGIIAVLALYIFFYRMTAYGLNLMQIYILPFVYASGMVPFQTWLVKSYFDQLPRSLDEAAFIDGANWFEIIFRVIFPASKAAFIIVLLFGFMGAWGEFFIAGIFNLKTLGWYLYIQLTGQAGLQDVSLYAAASILYATPIIILFILSQKYIGEAYRLGLKG
jgi:arabinogalactan oligomer/maltooligosaccharide transport system permease protein